MNECEHMSVVFIKLKQKLHSTNVIGSIAFVLIKMNVDYTKYCDSKIIKLMIFALSKHYNACRQHHLHSDCIMKNSYEKSYYKRTEPNIQTAYLCVHPSASYLANRNPAPV